MSRIFITGSSDGIGLATGKLLAEQGHTVVLHARNASRARDTQSAVPGAAAVLIGDLSSIAETKQLAAQVKNFTHHGGGEKPFDTIIHNAGIGYGATSSRKITSDGVSAVFAVNTLAPYILTCLLERPTARLLFMSSDSHYGGDESLRNAARSHSYADSKLHDVMLANAFARRWGDSSGGVQVVSMHPGWVRTKMGGGMAPGGLETPARVLAEWAVGKGEFAKLRSGAFFTTSGEERAHSGAANVEKQEELLRICKEVSGVGVPGE